MINYGTRFIMALKKNSLDNNNGVITIKKIPLWIHLRNSNAIK